MKNYCISAGCTRRRASQEQYCRRCSETLAESVAAVETDPALILHEYMSTCLGCSRDRYGVMLTHRQAKLLRQAGLHCAHCRTGLVQLEEVTTSNAA